MFKSFKNTKHEVTVKVDSTFVRSAAKEVIKTSFILAGIHVATHAAIALVDQKTYNK